MSTTKQADQPERAKPRAASLRLVRLDPWSAFKYSLVFSVFVFLVWVVTSVVLFSVLQALGVTDSLVELSDALFKDELREQVASLLTLGAVLKLSAVTGVVVAILFAVVATLLSIVHNVVSALTGGVKVTLRQ